MRRRKVILGAGALLAMGGGLGALVSRRGPGEKISKRSFVWKAADFRSGGTAGIPGDLPAPVFQTAPHCVVTLEKTIGPCHTNNVPIRKDITEGIRGLPTRVSLRIVEADSCKPIPDADVEIWHADTRGVYSGYADKMCNADNQAAQAAGFLRGRQVTNTDGQVSFLTVYPGWYSSRATHIHMRILIDARELLITQLLFDDALNDLIFDGHPDYAGRALRDTMNGGDTVFSAGEAKRFLFDVTKLDSGILQASYTIGVSA